MCVRCSGLDSSRLSAGRQLAVSPGAYMGYSRTESFSSMGGMFVHIFHICVSEPNFVTRFDYKTFLLVGDFGKKNSTVAGKVMYVSGGVYCDCRQC